MAGQPGFFDLSDRYEALSAAGDPLERLRRWWTSRFFAGRWWQHFGAAYGARVDDHRSTLW